MRQSLVSRLYSSATEAVDRRVGWHRLPWPLGMLTLVGIRNRLRARNLYDSGRGPLDRPPPDSPDHAHHLTARTLDGTYNDLGDPLMGALGSRFSGNGDALGAAFNPNASLVGDPQTDRGPSMTSRLDYTDEHGFMLADGGLPSNFGGATSFGAGTPGSTSVTSRGEKVLYSSGRSTGGDRRNWAKTVSRSRDLGA